MRKSFARITHFGQLTVAGLLLTGGNIMGGETNMVTPRRNENILVNGDFETWSGDKPDHWVAAEAYKTARSAEGEGCGARGRALILRTTDPTRSFFYQYPQVPYKTGQCVRFSVWLKLCEDSPPGAGGIVIQIGSIVGTPPSNSVLLGSNQLKVRADKGEYRQFSVVHRLEPRGNCFYAAVIADAPRRFYVDNAVMEFTDEPPTREPIFDYIRPDIPAVTLPAYKGDRYEAVVPDTLDLQEMAARTVHGLTSCVDTQADYEIYWRVYIAKSGRPVMFRDLNHQTQLIQQRGVPLMRQVSGTSENEQVERRWLEVLLHQRGPDDLFYYPLQGRPWIHFFKDAAGQYDDFQGDQYTGPLNNGWSLELLGLYYRLTNDPQFKEMGEKLTDAMIRHFVHREDYAFQPKGNYGVGEKPASDSPIPGNWFKNALMGWPAYAAVQFYRATGYKPALDFSGKLARFTWKHSGMFDSEARWLACRHGAWHTAPLFGILEYAIQAGDREMIDFVRKGYEYAKAPAQNMELLTGFTPENAEAEGQTGEICEVAFMLNLAVKLSAAGVGDYWDDVDRWVRNHFAEGQLTRCEWMDQIASGQPRKAINPVNESDDDVARKCLGAFAGWPNLNDFYSGSKAFGDGSIIMNCCTGEGSAAWYRVWENILRLKDGRLRVNLLLNRASPWADVDSSIPYEGRVDVKIKQACELSVRIPEWVKPEQAKCQVNGTDRSLSWDGRYAVIGKVEPKDVATLTFPIFERTDKVRVQGKEYTLIRKGNDVVHIDPPGKDCPLYQREKYRANKAQTKKVERFVAAQQLDW